MSNKVIELIQKLLALSTSPNEHEAAAAMAKAQELLLKHNLDMASVTAPTEEQKDDLDMINEIVDFDKIESWQSTLLNSISKRNFVHLIRVSTGYRTAEFHILGRRSNVKAVETMYNWLEPQILRLIAKSGYKRGEKISYAMGIISTIGKKLDEQIGTYQQNNPSSRALIVNVQKETDTWYKDQYPHTTSRSVNINHSGAYSHGRSDGHGVSVYTSSRQVNSSRLLLN